MSMIHSSPKATFASSSLSLILYSAFFCGLIDLPPQLILYSSPQPYLQTIASGVKGVAGSGSAILPLAQSSRSCT